MEMTLASVPTILPSHDGHLVGRVTASAARNSDIRGVSHPSSPLGCSIVHSRHNGCLKIRTQPSVSRTRFAGSSDTDNVGGNGISG
jgi:hypothetical protein